MTLNTQHVSDIGVGNGITTVFSITFQFYSSNELVVQFDDGVNPPVNQSPASYVVTGGNGSLGSITFSVAPLSGQSVIITRVLPLVQQASYTRNDPFPSATHEMALDRIVMMIQQTLAGAGIGASVTPEFIQDIVGSMFTDGVSTGITFTYNDALGLITAVVATSGIADAAADSKYYVRRNNAWIEETWANIINKPATFPPDAHTHLSSAITDLTAVTQATVAPMLNHLEHINIVFAYDPITKLLHASVLKGSSSNYRWNEAVTLVNPGAGFIAINTATVDLATHIVIANIDFDGLASSLATAVIGDTIILSNLSRTTPAKYAITAVTPQTGYIDYTVTPDTAFSSGNPQANDTMVVSLVANVGGIVDAPVDGVARTRKNAAWAALTWADIASIPSSFNPSPHTHPVADLSDASANGRSLISAANYAAMKTLLSLVKADVGLGSVDNVADASKPVSTAQAAADAVVLAAALAADKVVPENAQVGTTYTLVLTDAGKMVSMSNAGAITLTIPTNAAVAFPINTRIDLLQLGAGQVSVSPTGITLQSSGTKRKLTGQYSGATLWKKATDTWVLIGDIAT